MSLRKQATTGLIWTFSQQFGNQLIGFAVSLVLARILLPAEFGLIGMIAVFVAVGDTLLKSGLTQSIVRSKDVDNEDLSTVFFFNLAASLLIYILIYFTAPLIAEFYNQPLLKDILRLFCLTFVLGGLSAVQSARLTKIMKFKTKALISIPATIVAGIVGVYLAYSGFGVWSLVWSALSGSVVSTVLYWKFSNWKPQWVFNVKKFKYHFNFGYKITLAGLLETIFNNIYLIIIGKFYSASQVGFYTRADTMKQLPITNIANALNQVTFPLFSKIQDDDIKLKAIYKQLMQMVVFIISPVLIFSAVLAEPLFRFLFTEKWLPAVPYFQILCVTGILYPIHAYNLNILKVKGRSDLLLKLEIIQKIIIIVTVAVAINFGIIALLYGQIIISLIAFFINTHYTGKFLKYTALEQSKDILPIILLATFAGAIIFLIDLYQLSSELDLVRLMIGGLIGIVVYGGSSFLLGISSINELKKMIRN